MIAGWLLLKSATKFFQLKRCRWMDMPDIADYLLVPGGEFIFGSCETDENSEPEEWPQSKISVPAFSIKRTVVTVGEWRLFLENSRYEWDEWKTVAETSPTDSHPIVGVNWYDARAYCAWGSGVLSRRMRLSTEFEWEKACRGDAGQLYPTEINGSYDEKVYNWDEELETGIFVNRLVARCPARQSPYGCLDMWESVAEWCDNWRNDDLHGKVARYNGDIGAALADGDERYKAVRGGGYFHKGAPRCASIGYLWPSFRNEFLGFRPVLE